MKRVSVKPGTPRNTPGTRLGHPIIPRNTLETSRNTARTAKIVEIALRNPSEGGWTPYDAYTT